MARKAAIETPAGLTLTIERADLLKALGAAKGIAEANKIQPILSHTRLSAAIGGGLVMTVSDGDREATVTAPAEVVGAGACTVEFETLSDIARGVRPDSRITLRHDPDKASTTITSGRSRFVSPGFDVETYPQLEPPGSGYGHRIELAGSILAEMIGKTQFAISTEETRFYLGGIFCHAVEVDGGPRLRLVATDGHRLARYETKRAAGVALDMPGIILPRKTVTVLRQVADAAGDANVALEVAPTRVRIEASNLVIVSKLIDGKFPDYQRVIPENNERPMTAPTAEFAQACERVSRMALEKGRCVKLSLNPGRVTISLRNNDGGEASDEVDVTFDGLPLDIGFNGKYLAEMIGLIGGDTITLKFGIGPDAPVLMFPREGDEVLSVLMPMRLMQQ